MAAASLCVALAFAAAAPVPDFRIDVSHVKEKQWKVTGADDETAPGAERLVIASLGLEGVGASSTVVATDGAATTALGDEIMLDAVHAGDVVQSADRLAIEATHFVDALAGCERASTDGDAKVLCDAARLSTAKFVSMLLAADRPLLFPLRRTEESCGPNGDAVCSEATVAANRAPGMPYEIDGFVRVEVVHPRQMKIVPSTAERAAALAEHRRLAKLEQERVQRLAKIAELEAAQANADTYLLFTSTYPAHGQMGLFFVPDKAPCTIQVSVHPVVIGDELVSVNGIDVLDAPPTKLVEVLSSKEVRGKSRTMAWRRRKPLPDRPHYGRLQVVRPQVVAKCYTMRKALFGTYTPDCGEYKLAVSDPLTACDPVNRERVEGKVALVARGLCTYEEKLLNLQRAGAVGGIVINTNADLLRMPRVAGGVENITIPAMMIGSVDGTLLKTVVEMSVVQREKLMAAEPSLAEDEDYNGDVDVMVRLGDQDVCEYPALYDAEEPTPPTLSPAAAASKKKLVYKDDLACFGGFATETIPLIETDEAGVVKKRWVTKKETGAAPILYNAKLTAAKPVPKRGEALVMATIWNGTSSMQHEGAVASYGVLPPSLQGQRLVRADPANGCGGLRNAVDTVGSVVMVLRGECQFADKSRFLQKAGAVGMLMVDTSPGDAKFRMPVGPDGANDITIYSTMFGGNMGRDIDAMMVTTNQIVITFEHDLFKKKD